MKVVIRRVHLASLGRMGCLLGVVAAFLPSLLCGLTGLGLASLILQWLKSWTELTVSLLGQELARFDLVHFLGLEKVLDQMQAVASASGAVLLLAVLVLATVSGALLALTIILVGLAYNLLAAIMGGVVVDMSAVAQQEGTE